MTATVPKRSLIRPTSDIALIRAMIAAYCANQTLDPDDATPDDLAMTALASHVPVVNVERLSVQLHDMRNTLDHIQSTETSAVPQFDTVEGWIASAKAHHRALLKHPSHTHAGTFRKNRCAANNWQFVAHQRLGAFLKIGFELAQTLDHGMARAIALHFTWVEAHPFVDGNGRTARLLANDVLVAANQQPCTHSRRHRAEIAAAYHLLRVRHDPSYVIAAWDRTQDWTTALNFTDLGSALNTLHKRGDLRTYADVEKLMNNRGRTPEPTPLPDDEPLE